jgi:hypothetical protein
VPRGQDANCVSPWLIFIEETRLRCRGFGRHWISF